MQSKWTSLRLKRTPNSTNINNLTNRMRLTMLHRVYRGNLLKRTNRTKRLKTKLIHNRIKIKVNELNQVSRCKTDHF